MVNLIVVIESQLSDVKGGCVCKYNRYQGGRSVYSYNRKTAAANSRCTGFSHRKNKLKKNLDWTTEDLENSLVSRFKYP